MKAATLEQALQEASAKLSERKTVHEWLNQQDVPQMDPDGNKLCLLQRLAIRLGIHSEPKQ